MWQKGQFKMIESRQKAMDDLIQLFNGLKARTSRVGPLPPPPRARALHSLTAWLRLALRPGVACAWRIGGRSESDFSALVKLDVQFIEEQVFGVEIKGLVKTVPNA